MDEMGLEIEMSKVYQWMVSKQIQLEVMATFNTYDYDFLLKCLGEGSPIFKVEALKRLNTLAGADKKQFINNLRSVLTELESLYKEDKEEINYQSILLLNQIITNIPSKELQGLLYTRHLPLIIPALGHPTKGALRKAAHTVLLNTVKNFPQFTALGQIYLHNGFQSQAQLVQQKSINSFQSILILQARHFQWADPRSKQLIETLIDKIDHQNLFISKAASQCILSICKMEGIKATARKMGEQSIRKLKRFLEDIILKLPSDAFCITPNDLSAILQDTNRGTVKVQRYEVKEKEKQPEPDSEEDVQLNKETLKNNTNHRRLEKIKKSIKLEEKKVEKEREMIGGKLFSFVTGEGSLKERTEAMEDLLYKVQVSKQKPEFDSSMRAVFPILLKMLKDSNPKIVSLTLRILENCIQWISSNEQYLSNLVTIIVQKLSDQKISIRQNVSKVIKDLVMKTDKTLWVRQLLENLRKNTSTVLKDQTLYLIHYIYDSCTIHEQIAYPTEDILEQISYYTEDPKTKIKIRTLDCLSVIAYHSKQLEKHSASLKNKMSPVFYQMYTEKIAKLGEEAQKKNADYQKRNRRETIEKMTQQSFRSQQYRQHNDAKSEGDNQSQKGTNVSMQTIKKRVSLLRKPRNLLSTQETISLDNSFHKGNNQKSNEDVEIMLPSLYKKTGNKFVTSKRGGFTPNKTIQVKESKGDYLTKEDLKPLRDPQKQMRLILTDLKSTDWKVQFEATNKLRRLIQFHPDVILASTPATIHALVLDMIAMAQNLRSSVAKNSLICIYEFVQLMGRQIDAEMDLLLERLIKRSADTNAFISNQVQKCLNILTNNATPSKVLEKLAAYRDSKSAPIKEAIVATLISMKDNEKIRQKEYSKLSESLAFYLADGQSEVRLKAKAGIVEMMKSLKDWYRALRGKINPIYFKSICQLMTKAPSLRKQELHQTIQPKSTSMMAQKTETIQMSQKVEAPPTKRKPAKVSQFPAEFNEIGPLLQGSNSSDWKRRIQSVEKVKQIALKYPTQFVQYRSATHFLDALCKQTIQPNLKVSLNGLSTLMQIYEPLRMIIQNNLAIICNSVFATLSSNKPEARQAAERCTSMLLEGTDIQIIMQYLCHGILYALPRSRVYLLQKLQQMLQSVYQNRRQLLFKSVFPLLNKLMDQYKTELIPTVIAVFDKLYQLMGNLMFNHLTKFKEVRELIQK